MHSSTSSIVLLAAFAASTIAQSTTTPVTGLLGDAPKVNNENPNTAYVATLPNSVTSNVRGTISIAGNGGNTGVVVDVTIDGLPEEGGPFSR